MGPPPHPPTTLLPLPLFILLTASAAPIARTRTTALASASASASTSTRHHAHQHGRMFHTPAIESRARFALSHLTAVPEGRRSPKALSEARTIRVRAGAEVDKGHGVQEDKGRLATKAGFFALWAAYMWFVLLTPNAPGLPAQAMDPNAFKEAFELSVNFWFVTPIVLPQLAPVLHPAFEGLFETLVTWSVLYFGFITEARKNDKMPAFLVGSSFLTNIFYLPYLALRDPAPDLLPESSGGGVQRTLEGLVENKLFGPLIAGVASFAIGWGLFARPEYGGIEQRAGDLLHILQTDRLAYSFLCDMGIFAVLQSWMVPDDMKRRNFDNQTALWAARLVPLFGLAYYMAVRPPLSSDVRGFDGEDVAN